MVNPTWEERDLPVLKAIVAIYEANGGRPSRPTAIEQRTGFDRDTVQAALRALRLSPYVTKMDASANGMVMLVGAPTPEARQAVGLWPTPELLADRLVAALAQAAEREPDVERRGLLKRTAEWLGSAGRDVAVDVTAAVISRQVGGA